MASCMCTTACRSAADSRRRRRCCACTRSPLTGRTFEPLQRILGRDRSVYAPDLPGYGESDGPAAPPAIADYAAAMIDFLDTMRLRQIDVMGCQVGRADRGRARHRAARAGAPLDSGWPYPPLARPNAQSLLARPGRDRRARTAPIWKENGAGSARRRVGRCRPLWSRAAPLQRSTTAQTPPRGMHAAMQYPSAQRLGLVTQPVLLVRSADEYWESNRRRTRMASAGAVLRILRPTEPACARAHRKRWLVRWRAFCTRARRRLMSCGGNLLTF